MIFFNRFIAETASRPGSTTTRDPPRPSKGDNGEYAQPVHAPSSESNTSASLGEIDPWSS